MPAESNQMEMAKLLELMEKSLKYTPIVYSQNNYSDADKGIKYVLEFKHTNLPEDGLLFFMPKYSCREKAVLVIRTPKLQENGKYTYYDKEYIIEVETNKGSLRRTQANDIVGYRMCIFRFQNNSNSIVLTNSPLYNEAKFSNVIITSGDFLNAPRVYNTADNQYYTLVNSKEFEELKNRVSMLEAKIIYGNIDPEEALSDKEAGTIYIKVED